MEAVYIVKFSHQGRQRRQSLGEVTRGNLKAMRLLASDAKAHARLGRDILAERQMARDAFKNRKTLGSLVSEYLKNCQARLRSRTLLEVRRYMAKQWGPLHSYDIKAITRREVMEVLEDLKVNNGPRTADCAKVALHRFFEWAIDHKDGYVFSNPVAGIRNRAKNASRDRVLTDDEISDVWHACLDDDYGRIVKLLILTGQRKTEIGDLVWTEINRVQRQIELPSSRTKNKRFHIVPLTNEAMALLPPPREDREHIFGRSMGTGFSGWSKAKRELDERIAVARKAAGMNKPMPAWTIHDLRRTFVTHVLEKGLAQPHVVEACVNHVSGHKAGVAGVYNRAAYAEEKRAAMLAWAEWLIGSCAQNPTPTPMSSKLRY